MYVFAAAIVLLVASIFFVIVHDYIKLGILKYYIAWASALFSFMVWNTKRNAAKGKVLHIHHYDLALMLMTFITYQSPFASVVHAFCHGFFIEGGCRWGFDAMWEAPKDTNTEVT